MSAFWMTSFFDPRSLQIFEIDRYMQVLYGH